MSILINMEMPDNCTDCWFRKTARHEYLSDCQLCPFTGDTTPYLTRDKKCPLVPVPPHGRLIDGDMLKKIVASSEHMDAGIFDGKLLYSDHLCVGADYEDVCKAIDETPTIIPAELPVHHGTFAATSEQEALKRIAPAEESEA